MCPLSEYRPHREQHPIRHCADCGTTLSTGNLTDTCWQCEPTWSDAIATFFDQAEAFARLMEPAA